MDLEVKPDQPLLGMRILVADDEFLIAVAIEELLRDAGAEIVSAATWPAALAGATTGEPLSAALLDVRMGSQTTEAVADALCSRAVPFVFYSGQALPDRMRAKHPGVEVLIKPIKLDAVVEKLVRILKH
jgi:CheY-like chemotaxis protein